MMTNLIIIVAEGKRDERLSEDYITIKGKRYVTSIQTDIVKSSKFN